MEQRPWPYDDNLAWKRGFGAEFDRIARGELASSTETRLKELLRWGGFSSFMTPSALATASDAGVEPVGQVVGLCAGSIMEGYVRTTRPGQGRMRLGKARWRERTGPVTSWTAIRTRALARLTAQAKMLGADAVVEVAATRRFEPFDMGRDVEGLGSGQLQFTGTAVRVRGVRPATPMLTLASAPELWAMLRAGVQPAGIAGGFASVETLLGRGTLSGSVSMANVELEELTRSVYEVRRLAMERLRADARGLGADGLLGIDLKLRQRHSEPGQLRRPALTLDVHVLASAVRRARAAAVAPEPVLALTDGERG